MPLVLKMVDIYMYSKTKLRKNRKNDTLKNLMGCSTTFGSRVGFLKNCHSRESTGWTRVGCLDL